MITISEISGLGKADSVMFLSSLQIIILLSCSPIESGFTFLSDKLSTKFSAQIF